MKSIKTATCKRCGSTSVAWVQSKKTNRYYLAFAVQASYRHDGAIYPQTPHKCDDPLRGGFKPCPLCGAHHYQPHNPEPTRCGRHSTEQKEA